MSKCFAISVMVICVLSTQIGCSLLESNVDYNVDVKPILNSKCISCHGGVKQSNGFSLLSRDHALADTDSGEPAIIPGHPSQSEFIRRLTLDDSEMRMPLDGEPLTDQEIKTLGRWVKQGAEWGVHWAYRPLAESPEVLNMGTSTYQNEIDVFIDKNLADEGLERNPKAEDADLLRRVSFDLIGMPAPAELRESFLKGSLSYDGLIDSLLALPSFGEKWASMWLDVARYADSKGFERDQSRSIWKYRDYVIDAFNKDKPYNKFLIEQLAGDMLENPSEEQLIATGFHRNTATNDEGGTDNEEFRVKAVMDRVSTTWEGIMGTTMACVQCHGHPYDPFPHEDYYSSFAIFNNTRDADTAKDYPRLNFLDSLNQQELENLKHWIGNVDENSVNRIEKFVRISQPIIYSIETDELKNAALYDTKYLGFRNDGSARIPSVNMSGKQVMWINNYVHVGHGVLEVMLDSLNGEKIASVVYPSKSNAYKLKEIQLAAVEGVHDLYFHYSSPELTNSANQGLSIDWFYFGEPFPGDPSIEKQAKWETFGNLVNGNHESSLIMIENPADRQRQSYLFDRGNWLTPTTPIKPGTPGVLPPLSGEPNRLGFAEWVASTENPLTARTYVNRIWEQIFGLGIVTTVEDLGSQGSTPTHPELLDHLAYEFMHSYSWSTKKLLKAILTSATYQQSSVVSEEKSIHDPFNALISRGPRNRLTAEQIRDQSLVLSGLLVPELHGPPVMPYQPEGVWNTPYGREAWYNSKNEERFRRAIYTMIKRTSIYPAMETFDMASRQVCTSRRIVSNTPLQALVTLNDPAFIEMSSAIGRQILGEANVAEGIDKIYYRAMNKKIAPEKLFILTRLYEESKAEVEGKKADTIAAMTVANAIINLDDLLNK